jgi:hypothetical protein
MRREDERLQVEQVDMPVPHEPVPCAQQLSILELRRGVHECAFGTEQRYPTDERRPQQRLATVHDQALPLDVERAGGREVQQY